MKPFLKHFKILFLLLAGLLLLLNQNTAQNVVKGKQTHVSASVLNAFAMPAEIEEEETEEEKSIAQTLFFLPSFTTLNHFHFQVSPTSEIINNLVTYFLDSIRLSLLCVYRL